MCHVRQYYFCGFIYLFILLSIEHRVWHAEKHSLAELFPSPDVCFSL